MTAFLLDAHGALAQLPWQLQAVAAETLMSMFVSVYIITMRENWTMGKGHLAFWMVWDAAFLALFLTGATHVNLWFFIVVLYFVRALIGRATQLGKVIQSGEPNVMNLTATRDGTPYPAERLETIRNAAAGFTAFFYLSLLCMVVLGVS